MASFNLELTSKLNDLTQQLSGQQLSLNNPIENLDSSYQEEIDKVSKEKIKQEYELEKKKKKQNRERDFFNLSLKKVYYNFINTFSDIFLDLSELQSTQLPKLDEQYGVYTLLLFYLKKLAFIFFQKERLIYVGIGFIILSLFVYFVNTTE